MVAGMTRTQVLTFFSRKKLERIKESVRVCEAPIKTSPSRPNFSHVVLVDSSSSGVLILSADLPKKVYPP
jgi:hypothetical protein